MKMLYRNLKFSMLSTFHIITGSCFSQEVVTPSLTFSANAEFYYSYNFAKPANHEMPDFIYNYKRHNEFNINLAMAKASYLKDKVRGNLALQFGNYAQYNLSAEPNWAQHIFEANVGIKLSGKSDLWLDAGIFPSHIGFESAIGPDNSTLTRSIAAENSPYYETGVKLSFANKKQKLKTALFILNGWQKIKKPDAIQNPSLGLQINYQPSNKLNLNYSNFIGSDRPDSLHALRLFHNLYAIYKPNDKICFTAGFDIGTDKYNATDRGIWYTPVLIAMYSLNNKYKIAARAEYYWDEKQIILVTNTTNGFKTFGSSFNFDNQITNNVVWRTEVKYYKSKDSIFSQNGTAKNNNLILTTSLSIKFQ